MKPQTLTTEALDHWNLPGKGLSETAAAAVITVTSVGYGRESLVNPFGYSELLTSFWLWFIESGIDTELEGFSAQLLF